MTGLRMFISYEEESELLAEAIDGLAWVAKSKAPTYGAANREEVEL